MQHKTEQKELEVLKDWNCKLNLNILVRQANILYMQFQYEFWRKCRALFDDLLNFVLIIRGPNCDLWRALTWCNAMWQRSTWMSTTRKPESISAGRHFEDVKWDKLNSTAKRNPVATVIIILISGISPEKRKKYGVLVVFQIDIKQKRKIEGNWGEDWLSFEKKAHPALIVRPRNEERQKWTVSCARNLRIRVIFTFKSIFINFLYRTTVYKLFGGKRCWERCWQIANFLSYNNFFCLWELWRFSSICIMAMSSYMYHNLRQNALAFL